MRNLMNFTSPNKMEFSPRDRFSTPIRKINFNTPSHFNIQDDTFPDIYDDEIKTNNEEESNILDGKFLF